MVQQIFRQIYVRPVLSCSQFSAVDRQRAYLVIFTLTDGSIQNTNITGTNQNISHQSVSTPHHNRQYEQPKLSSAQRLIDPRHDEG